MAVGQFKIGVIIQARMHSTRMPGKVLIPIPFPDGKPVLAWIIDEIRNSNFISDVFIATSENSENNLIEEFAKNNHVMCFRGSEVNVLSRFISIIEQNKLDIVVRLTGDNPFIDIVLLDQLIERHIENSNDYTNSTGLPIGMNFEIISGKKLMELEHKKLSLADQEHVTFFIQCNPEYKRETVNLCKKEEIANLRLTIDHPSDFSAASLILGTLTEIQRPNLNFITEIYQNHPWIFDINSENIQKQEFIDVKDEFIYASTILKKLNLNRSAEILENAIIKLSVNNE